MQWLRDRPLRLLLAAGAVAAAIASIIGLTGTVRSFFNDPSEGTVSRLRITSVNPVTYGEWLADEGAGTKGVPAARLGLRGWEIVYRVDTSGFAKNTVLPLQLIRRDVTVPDIQKIQPAPITVVKGAECSCKDWVLIPSVGHCYYVELSVYPPGWVSGSAAEALWTDSTGHRDGEATVCS